MLSTAGCGMQWATTGSLILGYTYVSHEGKAAHEMGHVRNGNGLVTARQP